MLLVINNLEGGQIHYLTSQKKFQNISHKPAWFKNV